MTFGNAAIRHSLSLIVFLKWIDFSVLIFTQLFLCFTFPTWMSTLIYKSQKLSMYIILYVYINKRLIFHMDMWIIFEIDGLK